MCLLCILRPASLPPSVLSSVLALPTNCSNYRSNIYPCDSQIDQFSNYLLVCLNILNSSTITNTKLSICFHRSLHCVGPASSRWGRRGALVHSDTQCGSRRERGSKDEEDAKADRERERETIHRGNAKMIHFLIPSYLIYTVFSRVMTLSTLSSC